MRKKTTQRGWGAKVEDKKDRESGQGKGGRG